MGRSPGAALLGSGVWSYTGASCWHGRARKARSRRLLDPHVDARRRPIHVNSADQPRELDAKQRRLHQPVFPAAVSSSTREESLQIAQPLGKGETIVVYEVNADPPEPTGNFYFICQCRNFAFQGSKWNNRDTIARLTDSIQDGNPTILATKGSREELKSRVGVELPQPGLDVKLSDIFTAKVLEDHVRYLLFVNEKVETTIHVPLYFFSGGVAACGHKTILEAGIWEMPSGRFIGTLTASA